MARRVVGRTFTCGCLPRRWYTTLNEVRSERQLCDISFNMGNTTISAHRVILAAAIPYFRNVFESEVRFSEAFPDIETNVFRSLIDYAYRPEVNINPENVEGLLDCSQPLARDEVTRYALLNEMRNEGTCADIQFNVRDRTISAHRVILAAAIPYFRRLFAGEVNDPQIEPDVLTSLVDYAYTCEVNINTDNAQSLLAASCGLGIDEIKEACCDFLSDNLEPETAYNVRELARRFNCEQLLEDVDNYITENFNAISQTADFLGYPATYLRELIGKDDLNVENEEQVLDAVLCWVRESPEDRRIELPYLLRRIRMTLMETLYLANTVEREELIRTSSACRDLIDEAKIYNLDPEMLEAVCSFNTQPRIRRVIENRGVATTCFHCRADNM